MARLQYLDKQGVITLVKEIKKRTSSVYVIKGSAVYADEAYLASPDKVSEDIDRVGLWHMVDGTWEIVEEVKLGWVYNVTNDFTTTVDFVEGAGVPVPAGTNIVAAEFKGAADSTTEVRWDLLSSNMDLTGYQTKKLLYPLDAFDDVAQVESYEELPDIDDPPADGALAVITAGDDAGAVYRATVSDTNVSWRRLGDQVTVEGALTLFGNLMPNTPISAKEITDIFNSGE